MYTVSNELASNNTAAIGLADEPSYYGVENGLDVLAGKVRSERLAVGTGSELIPWLTPGATGGTGGPPDINNPGGAMFNMLIQCWANGATGFNVYTSQGVYDMSIWRECYVAISLYSNTYVCMCFPFQIAAKCMYWSNTARYLPAVAMRDAIALVAPHEDLVMDGVPSPVSAFSKVRRSSNSSL